MTKEMLLEKINILETINTTSAQIPITYSVNYNYDNRIYIGITFQN